MISGKWAGLVALMALAAPAVTGCAAPKAIVGMDIRNDQLKMLYQQGGDFGVVRCKAGSDGALSQCQNVKVTLHD
jgi:hypothetical protein